MNLFLDSHFVFPLLGKTLERGQSVGESVHPDVPVLLLLRHQVQLPRVALWIEDDGERRLGTEPIESCNKKNSMSFFVNKK